ncbi:hypothetical protein J4573_14665 [Actinomadura barringtoniae]|uniref:Secreted protein n=1 Tax=Actinomadura barringtoniae TaxID=1427535 RepID=A0A939T9U3_9ACTN|nr:hypothetical protein [Actinomadura barringtoniae]MBO2448345.1 hypothetical protein [Actinomadura barringtoniae]
MSGRARRRTFAAMLAGGAAAAALTAAQGAPAQATTFAKCTSAQHDTGYAADPPPRIVAQGECTRAFPPDGEGANLNVRITRNGTVVWSGGNGVGIVTAVYNCRGNAWGDFTATWSTGQVDGPFSAPCG